MSAMASVLTPFDRSPAIELANAWRKRILPVGSISYQGRTLNFTRSYLQGLVSAWQKRAYDSVPFQLGPGRAGPAAATPAAPATAGRAPRSACRACGAAGPCRYDARSPDNRCR